MKLYAKTTRIILNKESHYIQLEASIMEQSFENSSIRIKRAWRFFCFSVSLFLLSKKP